MAARDVPEPWADWLRKGGLVDPRNGAPSMTRLAEAADIHPTTIGAMMYGTRRTQPEKVEAVADALSKALRLTTKDQRTAMRMTVHRTVGRSLKTAEPFVPHPDADLLEPAERKAINELIRLLATAKKSPEVADLEAMRNEALRRRHAEVERQIEMRAEQLRGVAKKGDIEEPGEFI